MNKRAIAIIGQGRSGKQIHGAFLRSEQNVYFDVRYIVDEDAGRRQKAQAEYPDATVLASYTDLYDHDDIDLVVNASYSQQHYPITKDLLEHGFHVLVEKPMGRTRAECDELIALAEQKEVLVAAFQQSFFAPYYRKAQEVVASGVLGEILQIDLTYSNLARRWDWQTLQKKVAGSLYNTGPHPVGLALGFLDFDPAVRVVHSRLATGLTSGDADDYAKVILTAPDKPTIDIEISAMDACPARVLKIQGTRGTFATDYGEYFLKYVADGENVERPVQETFLQDANGEPLYCSERLISHEETGTLDAGGAFTVAVEEMYKDLYAYLTEGKPLRIPATVAAQVVEIIDEVHQQNPLPVRY